MKQHCVVVAYALTLATLNITETHAAEPPPAASTQGLTTTVKVLKWADRANTAYELYDQMDTFLTIRDYAIQVRDASRRNALPPSPPAMQKFSSGLITKLEAATADIAKIELPPPPFKKPPSFKELGDARFEQFGELLDRYTLSIESEGAVQAEITKLIEALVSHSNKVVVVNRALGELQKGLEDILTKPVFAPVFTELGMSWFDLSQNIRPKVAGLGTAISNKQKDLRKKIPARRQDVTNLLSVVSLIEQGVSERLGKERARVESRMRDPQTASTELDAIRSEIENLNERIQAAVDAHSSEIESANSAIAEADAKADAEKIERDNAKKRFGKMETYNYCPNGEPWEKCTHDDLKAKWDRDFYRFRDAYDSAKKKYDRAKKALDKQRDKLASLQKAKSAAIGKLKTAIKSRERVRDALVAEDANAEWLKEHLALIEQFEPKAKTLRETIQRYYQFSGK